MKTTCLIFVIICLTFLSCKKTKLSGGEHEFVGTWHWVGGWGDKGSSDYKLHILEKGNYKLYKGSQKWDYGRIVKEGSFLKFKSDNAVYVMTQRVELVNQQIVLYHYGNRIELHECDCDDSKSSIFERD